MQTPAVVLPGKPHYYRVSIQLFVCSATHLFIGPFMHQAISQRHAIVVARLMHKLTIILALQPPVRQAPTTPNLTSPVVPKCCPTVLLLFYSKQPFPGANIGICAHALGARIYKRDIRENLVIIKLF